MTEPKPSHVVVHSPNAPRPDDPLIIAVADTLMRAERNYLREGSGPGTRFEGQLLEDVQAKVAVSMVRAVVADAIAAERLKISRWTPLAKGSAADVLDALEARLSGKSSGTPRETPDIPSGETPR